MKKYLVFDVGATNIKRGIIDARGDILQKDTMPTPQAYKDFIDILQEDIAKTSSDAVVLALPGVYDKLNEKLLYAPNLKELTNRNIIGDLGLKDRFIFIENDANLAALGEYQRGFTKKPNSLFFLTLGTGVGGAFINDGSLFSGQTTLMQVGHMTLVADGRHCGCGKRGCFEKYCSTGALNTFYLEESGVSLTPIEIAQKADEGDFAAYAAFEIFALHLAHGIASIINILNPSAVRVGGGLSELEKYYFPVALELLSNMIFAPYQGEAEIKIAALKNDAALYGGVVWAEKYLGE
ncbi:MAG: ROK family protein [Deferribacteraceae bacterium]|jgi:glucokinase|nr:ROK family protein [Deferribacteraceae bacterium]